MERIVDKLGFFDFFNHIIVGLFTIIGCFGISFQFSSAISKVVFSYLVERSEVNMLFLALCLFSIVTVSYILGLLCHEFFSLIDDKIIKTFEKLNRDLFTAKSCVDNELKRNRYKKLAESLYKNNNIPYDKSSQKDKKSSRKDKKSSKKDKNSSKIDTDLNIYFFAYCLYQLQIRGLNTKTEKLRDIEGLAMSFCVSTFLLFVILIWAGITSWSAFSLPKCTFWIEVGILFFSSLIFNEYRKQALKNRIRMTLSLYEAVFDKEKLDEARRAQ